MAKLGPAGRLALTEDRPPLVATPTLGQCAGARSESWMLDRPCRPHHSPRLLDEARARERIGEARRRTG